MRRRIFQDALPDALSLADTVLFGPVSRAQLLADDDRLSPEAIAAAIRTRGPDAHALGSADEVAGHIAANSHSGDVVLIMSNGSFDGLTGKLFEKLHAASGVRA